MAIILLNQPKIQVCSLCTLPAFYLAMISIRAYDEDFAKEVMREMEMPVCESHAEILSIEIKKRIESTKKKLILV